MLPVYHAEVSSPIFQDSMVDVTQFYTCNNKGVSLLHLDIYEEKNMYNTLNTILNGKKKNVASYSCLLNDFLNSKESLHTHLTYLKTCLIE